MRARDEQNRRRATRVALVGNGAWFVANAYEGLVDVPQLLIDSSERRRPGVLAAGSPVRYFALNAPAAILPTAAALVLSWKKGERSAVLAAAGAIGTAVALSGYLIRTVNVPLLTSAGDLDGIEADRMKKRWHVVNAARLVSLGLGIAASKRLRTRR